MFLERIWYKIYLITRKLSLYLRKLSSIKSFLKDFLKRSIKDYAGINRRVFWTLRVLWKRTILKLIWGPTNLKKRVVDKFTKLIKIVFSMACFKAGFSQFSSVTVKVFLLGVWLVTRHQFQSLQGVSQNFLISWNPRLKLFDNSSVNSYMHFLVIII